MHNHYTAGTAPADERWWEADAAERRRREALAPGLPGYLDELRRETGLTDAQLADLLEVPATPERLRSFLDGTVEDVGLTAQVLIALGHHLVQHPQR